MALRLKMWWIISCKCDGSLVGGVKTYYMVVYLVAYVDDIQYWLKGEDVVAHWL
jgi:hypothetical protein